MVRKIRKFASHATQGFEDRTAEIKEKILSIAKVLRHRTRESWEEVDKIHEKLISFENKVLENREFGRGGNGFSKYYAYMYTGTTSRQARVVRGEMLCKYVLD